jgi:hypothetical protein
MISKKLDSRVKGLMQFHGFEGDPSELVGRLCAELLADTGEGIPVDLEVLASYRNAHLTLSEQEQSETIHWDGQRFQIHVRNSDSPGRQRFSCAHAILHTWFFESGDDQTTNAAVRHSWSEAEEDLCDFGAAALLLPEAAFRDACPQTVTMGHVLELAADFQASAEATALRAVALSPTPLAMMVLEIALKPAEQKEILKRRMQPTLPGMADGPEPTPRLRVVKSFGRRVAFIPRHKSVEDTNLALVVEEGGVNYVGAIGVVDGIYRVSAMNLPMHRNGELVDRVVALVAPDI